MFMQKIGFVLCSVCLIATACDQASEDPPVQDTTIPAGPAAVASSVDTAPRPAEAIRPVDFEWSVTDGSSSNGKERGGSASLAKDGILSVIAFNNPVKAGDTISIKALVIAPAGRKLRVVAQRHCDAVDDSDATDAEFEMTGNAVPVEVSHKFANAYSCSRLSVHPVDRQPIEITLRDVEISKTPGPQP